MAKLHVFADRLGTVTSVTTLLNAINDLYIGLSVFEEVSEKASSKQYDLTPEERLLRAIFGEKAEPKESFHFKKEIARELRRAKPLQLSAASFSSPGFWEFLGSLNPLQQIREWVKDNHERKKDELYKMGFEKSEKSLLIEQLKLNNLREKISILRDVGVPEEEIQNAVRELIVYPLKSLSEASEIGLVHSAEIIEEQHDPVLEHSDEKA